MTLTVTPGASNSDSYQDLATFKSSVTTLGLVAPGTDPELEAALRRAAIWLDANFRYRWPGTKTNGRSQARDWPRTNAVDLEDIAIGVMEIPSELLLAQTYAASQEAKKPFSLSPVFLKGNNEKVLVAMDTMRWETRADAGTIEEMKPVLIDVQNALSTLISFSVAPFFGVV